MGAYADLLANIGQPSSGGPGQSSPGIEGFIKAYAPQAERVAAQTGNDPALYLAQWGLETGWGKSIIPGTNNLGNIKDFSGSGVAARDNMTGSRDKYRQYDTPDAFADDFAGLLGRRYKGALNVGNDPVAFASALKQNGYAEDPAYVSKIKAAHNLVAQRYSGQPANLEGERTEPQTDYSSLLDRYGKAPSSTLAEQSKADGVRASIEKGRSFGEAIGDTGASVLKGIGHFGESMGGLYGLATGDVDPNIVQNGGKALADFAESLKSDFIKNKERLSQQDIDAAEGHFNKFATAAWSNMSDPALFVNFLAEQAINFVPGMATGRIAKGIIAGLGGASAAAIEAAPLAQKAMLMKRLETAGQVGTGVSVATGAVLQGADAGNSAYQQVMARPQTEWDANPEYQKLVTTQGRDGAKQQIALQEARTAFAKSAVMSAGLNSFAPAHSIDKILVNGLKNKSLTTAGREVVEKAAGQTLTRAAGTGAVKGFLGESASEALDEGYSQYAANQAEAAVNPNKDLLDEVAQNAGLGAAFGPIGAVTGGIEGASRRKSAQELLQIATEQAAAQPNSPLSRAAAAAGPAVQAADQVATEQAAATDPLAEQVAAIGDRLNDRAIYNAIRSHENLGPQALSDILGAYRVASNFKLDIKQRQAAVERLNNFFQLFDNQPNFTMGANGEAGQGGPLVPAGRGGDNRRQAADVPTYDVGAPALGYQRQGDTLTDERAKQAATAEYEQAYQDLVKAEQLGAGDQELMQRQIALRQAEARLQEIQRTIDGNRQLETSAKRDALLGDVLAALPPGQNPNRAFDRALRNAGFTDTQFSDDERAKIAQWQQLSDGFMQQDAEPSKPNEMDPAALGIKEKHVGQAPANPNLAKVDAMLKSGMQRKGDKMFDPRTGKSIKLSPAQIARAKHIERQNERSRVMPAYQQAIAQRTRALEQLLADPNHDEAAAVRLARGLSGLKQMVEQLQRGASLDEAIGNVFGQVGSQFANQLKNPKPRNDDGDAQAAVEEAPKPNAPRGGGRLTALQDERLGQYGAELRAMAGDAGWAEEGGKLIRNDDGTMSRTRWIPRAEWFVAGMLNSPQASEEAVRKALAGEPMYRAEKLHVSGMMDFLDAQHASSAESALLESLGDAISEDSDFGLPDYSAESAAVIELEFAQGSVDVPAFLDALGESNEENNLAKDEAGARQAGSVAAGESQENGQDRQDSPGAGRAGSQSQGFGLTGQTNQQAAAEYKQKQEEANKKDDQPAAPNVRADQADLFNTQSSLFNSNRDAAPASKEDKAVVAEYTVSTEDDGDIEIRINRRPNGDMFIQRLDDGQIIEYNKDFAAGKSDADLIKYTFEPLGYEGHKKAGAKPDVKIDTGFVSRAIYDATNADPTKKGDSPLSVDDAQFILESLLDRAKRGKLTPETFAQSDIGQRLDTATVMAANAAIKANPVAAIEAMISRLNEISKPESAKPFDEAARAAERKALYDKVRAEAQANPRRTEELSKVMPEFDAETERLRKAANQQGGNPKDDNSGERLVERAEAVAKKYDDAGYPDHGKIIRASLETRQPSRDNVEFWEASFDRNLAQWKAIEKANAGASSKPVEPKLRTADDLIETRNEERAYDLVPGAVIDAVLDKLNGYIKELAAKGLHIDEVDSRFPNNLQVIKRNESGLRGTFNRYAKQLNAIKRGYKRANEDGFADTEQELSEWIGVDLKKLREEADRPGAETVTAPEKSEASNSANKLPSGWSESEPGGMATNKDPETGGIVDKEIVSGKWFAVANKEGIDTLEGFDSRAAALDALASAVSQPKKDADDLDNQLRDVEDELASQGRVQNARTREKRDQLRKAILERDNPAILKALDGVPDFAEAVVSALRFNTGSEPKADTVRRALKNKGVVEPHLANMTNAVMSAIGDGQQQGDTEPNLAAAKALIQEAKDTHGDKRKEAIVRKKARELAQKTPLSDEKTVLALDMVSTRLGMGDGGTKALEFLPAVNAENAQKSERGDDANQATDEQEAGGDTEKLGDLIDYERFVLISADDISKLRKVDVERVLSQGAVKEFRQEFADWIKAKRPDLAQEVDVVMADIAPAMTYDQFKAEMQRLFSLANKYKPGEIGFNEYSAKMADLSDAHPEFSERLDEENDGEPAAPSSEMDDLKAQMGQAFDELASILGVKKNLTPEEESALIPVMAKIFRLAAKMGYVKFKDAARYVVDALRGHNAEVADKLSIDNLQAGYINIAREIGGNKRDALDIESIDDLYADDAASDIGAKIAAAEQATNHDATPAQKEAGNYAKGKFPWNGLTISVETAKGEDRTDKETNGEKWRVTMPATYGYILGTTGADGDHVDAFMGPNPDSDKVFVINQMQVGSEKFDEHKVMLGYPSERAAKADYMASFSDGFGRKVFGSIEGPFSVEEFRRMLDDGEFERKEEIDFGRRLNERTPLSDINVTVEAVEAETGRTVEMDETAADALKDVDDRMKLARSLLECLGS